MLSLFQEGVIEPMICDDMASEQPKHISSALIVVLSMRDVV